MIIPENDMEILAKNTAMNFELMPNSEGHSNLQFQQASVAYLSVGLCGQFWFFNIWYMSWCVLSG